ncbi:protein Aster-C-like isoform X2 [Oscarella lobularis]
MLNRKPSSETLLRHFPALPDGEDVFDSFGCALKKEILISGRLYVTPRYFCFHANILGIEKKVTIDCSQIACLRQEMTARIFPNAIGIEMKNGVQYHFSSFLRRNETHRLLFCIWRAVINGKPLTIEQLRQRKRRHYHPQTPAEKNRVFQKDFIVSDQKEFVGIETDKENQQDERTSLSSSSTVSTFSDVKEEEPIVDTGHSSEVSEEPEPKEPEKPSSEQKEPEIESEKSDSDLTLFSRLQDFLQLSCTGLLQFPSSLTKRFSASQSTLFTFIALLVLFCFTASTFLLACQMSAIDPLVARYFPLKGMCSFDPVRSRLSSFSLSLSDSITTINAALDEMRHLQDGICLPSTPAVFTGLSARLGQRKDS